MPSVQSPLWRSTPLIEMTEHIPCVSNRWLEAMSEDHQPPLVQFLVERSSGPDGRSWSIYLCGECSSILARRLHAEPPEETIFHCSTCGTLNEA